MAQQEGAGHAVLSAYVEIVFDNSDNRIPVRKRKTGMSLPSTMLFTTLKSGSAKAPFQKPRGTRPILRGLKSPCLLHGLYVMEAAYGKS